MTKEELQKRFKIWAIDVVLFTRKFPENAEFKVIQSQIIRSAPSAAANYRAACRGKSGKDFINKLKIVEEETDESMFWMEFSVALDETLRPHVVNIYKEANELVSITVASLKTARSNQKSEKNKPPKKE
jgi:four helix bundle protein